ncbi:crossover junction endodeoxyribonuclease RuvA [Thermoclostridium stercorarium subsp. thermolacticum DSM 2910]|uniref:Putative pre-16S rRNA nuclease n=1 Tax=Thermoclostridium stercorarium subsp. thermolacticum DSM 2910 TaxID=1121336 RepID=A0A1B1YEZ0_THEST|nr:Holliday junction resolvase RuvX [Thermoclostridium stercorarium]ANW99342.1 crossover junction endodeoxyribonuclease RuvA [Thermoclostridium stercorarium subsp. thermolacticum DSM 2910]
MRILGIDFGDARIGVAVSDPLGITAQAVETIHWKGEWKRPLERIKQLTEYYGCDTIVVGFPENMNGTVGERGIRTQRFIEKLKEYMPGVSVIPWDERLSTAQSRQVLLEMGINSRRHKGKIDQIAASIILQSYMDARKRF